MMQNEKSGGHSERSVGIGTIEVAVWDAVAKIAEKPLHRLLAERYNGGKAADKVFCYVGGGWYAPGKTTQGFAGRDAAPSRCRLHHGEDESRRHDACRRSGPRRGGEIDPAARRHARGRRQFEIRPRRRARLCARAEAVRAALVRGAVRSARLCAPCRDRRRLRRAAVHRRESVLHAGRRKPGALRRAESRSATTSSRSIRRRPTASCNMPARSTCWRGINGRAGCCSRTAATRCRSPSPPASGSAARNPIPACSAISAASPTMPSLKDGYLTLSDRPGIGFEGQARLYRIMAELAM